MNERDCISRAQAMEVVKGLSDWSDRDEWACAMNAIEKLPRAVVSDCDDCVSRGYLKKELDEWGLEEEKHDAWNKAIKVLIDIIDDAPNVAPTEAVQGCDGCKYDTTPPRRLCLRCKRYWRDGYERKGGDSK